MFVHPLGQLEIRGIPAIKQLRPCEVVAAALVGGVCARTVLVMTGIADGRMRGEDFGIPDRAAGRQVTDEDFVDGVVVDHEG